MRLTTKGRHAIDAMIELALRQHRNTVKLAEIADRQRVSISYLELLFAKLRRGGLVASVRGPGGGYRLAKPMDAISMADIVNAVDSSRIVEETDDEVDEIDAVPTKNGSTCHTDVLWAGLANAVHDYLQAVTLADFAGPAIFDADGQPAVANLRRPPHGLPPGGRALAHQDRAILP